MLKVATKYREICVELWIPFSETPPSHERAFQVQLELWASDQSSAFRLPVTQAHG